MEHPVKRIELPPLPEAKVFYEPEYQVLVIENGEPSEVGEEMARQVHIMYDKDIDNAPTSAVTILIDSAEVVLKPFVDAILVKQGITPDPDAPRQRHKKGYRETVITQIQRVEWELAPYSEATYDPDCQTLLIENGDSSKVSREMAKDIHVLYDKDDANAPWSAVAIRIDHAETVLKPFVDAILAKYDIAPKNETQTTQYQIGGG